LKELNTKSLDAYTHIHTPLLTLASQSSVINDHRYTYVT